MTRYWPLAAAALLLSGCMKEVVLTPQAPSRLATVPFSARVDLVRSTASSNAATPILFDLKPAMVSYFRDRGTFRDVVDSGGDAALRVRSRFSFSSSSVFHYRFDLDAELVDASGRQLGMYRADCQADGGMIRLSAAADREPMNRALSDCLDKLAGDIEGQAASLGERLHGGSAPVAAAAAAPAEPSAPVSSVDRPSYRRAEDPHAFALVIGIERYEGLPAAEFAEHDAAAVRAHLRALGYPERNIIYLTGPKASLTGIQKYVETWLPLNVDEQSKLFVYFSGHGAPDTQDGQAYLVPWDGDAKFLKNTGYPLKRLYGSLNALKARQIVVAMDACFTGEGGRSVLAKGARPLVTKVDTSVTGGKLVVLAAAGADEITSSTDAEGHGLFTYYLLKSLQDREGDGAVRPLFDALKSRVQDGARRDGREQTPQLLGAPAAAVSL